MIQLPIILAADIGDLFDNVVPFLVFILVVIGSIIKHIAEGRKKKSKRAPREAASPPVGEQPTTRQRMDEVAEQRKRQLQELARRRREAAATPPAAQTRADTVLPSDQVRPSREEAERQRRRAEALRHAQQRKHQSAETARTHHQRAQQARQREADRRAQQMRELDRRDQTVEQPQIPQAPRMIVSAETVGHDTEQVHRHVADVQAPTRRLTGHAEWARQLTNATPMQLQRAIILKEILEQPLAFRDPVALPMER